MSAATMTLSDSEGAVELAITYHGGFDSKSPAHCAMHRTAHDAPRSAGLMEVVEPQQTPHSDDPTIATTNIGT